MRLILKTLLASPWVAPVAVFFAAVVLYLPGAGSYGLWDPWETHYGEVARQMAVRGDYISLWWPCSPRETDVFQTKPVLSYWLMSLSLRFFGVTREGAPAGEIALGSVGEWAVRTPFSLLAAFALVAIYLVTARLAGRRAGFAAALATATMPMFALIARQAMTDMTFLAMMAPAIALFVLALEPDEGGALAEVNPRLTPRGAALATGALFAIAVVPQLLIDSLQLRVRLPWPGGWRLMYGVIAMAPYWLGAAGVALYLWRTRRRDCLALVAAATFAGLGVLAKGLAGLALPVLVALVYVVLRGSWRRLGQREILGALGVALIVVVVVAVPWHHAMYIRHGAPWWNELFGDNHWRRMVLGRHGDRGSFVYFLRELGYGAWPVAALALAACAPLMRPGRLSPAHALGAAWFVTAFAVVSLSMTKFHHYLLPALPGLGILIGCLSNDLINDRQSWRTRPLVLVGLPVTIAVTADFLARQDAPEKFLWLFSYDYVHSRGGRPWPPALELRAPLLVFGIGIALATLLLAWPRVRRAGLGLLLASALGATVFLIDGFMPRVAVAWSQKGTLARYYRERRDAEEHLIAYYMFWRGESFYSKNAIYEGPPEERTVFDHLRDTDERLRAFLDRHRGRRQFFLFEPGREAHLRTLLPTAAAASFRIIERSNNKFVLAVAEL